MTDEKQNDRPEDEVIDEMPASGGAPCGDAFAAASLTYVTDADADAEVSGAGQED